MTDPKSGSRKMVQDNYPMIDQVMMLRFRPIAPKPEGVLDSGGSRFGNKGLMYSGIRTKREYVRVRRTQTNNYTDDKKGRDPERKRKIPEKEKKKKKIVTLQLLPEKAEEADKGDHENDNSFCPNPRLIPVSITGDHNDPRVYGTRPVWVCQTGRMDTGSDCVESRVIVVTINTGSSIDGVGLGLTDMEKVNGLGSGGRPGFVSDPSGWVLWVNGAYEAMVLRQLTAMNCGSKRRPEMVVQLVVKEGLLVPYWTGSFTSQVKIDHTWCHQRWCDVWRMDSGGFAWRLDLDAALTLAIDTSTKAKNNGKYFQRQEFD